MTLLKTKTKVMDSIKAERDRLMQEQEDAATIKNLEAN